jgi:hypothetical protein
MTGGLTYREESCSTPHVANFDDEIVNLLDFPAEVFNGALRFARGLE